MLGFLLGLICVVAAILLEGGNLHQFFRPGVMVLVLGGSTGAALTSQSCSSLWWAWRGYRRSRVGRSAKVELVKRLSRYGGIVRHRGLMRLDGELKAETEVALSLGIQCMLDGGSWSQVEAVTRAQCAKLRGQIGELEMFFESLAGYSPTFGLIGTVIGMVTMMAGVKQPGQMATGISAAFLATFYGMLLANLIFLPLAHRLKTRGEEYAQYCEHLVLGLNLVMSGTASISINERMSQAMGLDPVLPAKRNLSQRVVALGRS